MQGWKFDPISVFVLKLLFTFLPFLNVLHKESEICLRQGNPPGRLQFLFFIPFSSFLQLLCPRQRRKSGQEGVDMEGLQAGLEKLAMKPRVHLCSIQLLSYHIPGFGDGLYLFYL